MNKQPIVALIPARGGSKGIPKKNLIPLVGKPLIQYTTEAALRSEMIQEVYVSSDDASILELAAKAGCKKVIRPAELSTDETLAVDVVKHFLSAFLNRTNGDPIIVYLQPTSPCRKSVHIDEALTMMIQAGAPGIVSVSELKISPYKSFCIDENGRLHSLLGEHFSNLGRQQLPRTFATNGAIYAFRKSAFVKKGGFPSDGSLAYVMNQTDSVDIDNQQDLLDAEKNLNVSDNA